MICKGWLAALTAMIAVVIGAAPRVLAAPPSVEAYGRLPNVELMRLSPDGDKIAFVAVEGADLKLHVTTADGKSLHDVDCHNIKLRALDWADDDHVVLTASVTMAFNVWSPRGEFLVAIALNVPRHALSVVLSQQNELVKEIFGEYGFSAAEGHAYGYFGAIAETDLHYKGAGLINLYRVDLDTGDRLELFRGVYNDEDFFVDPASGVLAATAIHDERSGDWRIELGDKVLAKGRGDYGGARVLSFGRTRNSLLISYPGSGGDIYKEVRRDGSGSADVEGGDKIADFVTDPATGLLIGETGESDARETTFFDPAAEAKWRAALAVVGGAGRLISFSEDLGRMIVLTEGDRDSGTWWLADTVKHTAKVVGRAYPDIPADQVGPVQIVDYKAADGMELHGVLTLPPGKTGHGLPLVVLPHGGPQVRDYVHFDWWAQAFAARGYAVFQPNFRGSDGYGAGFVEATYGQWGRKMQTDISDGVAALAAKGVIDPKRACIVGGSYGGYAALAGVTVQQGLYRCAVSWGGVADPASMLQETSRHTASSPSDATRYWRHFLGADTPGAGIWAQFPPCIWPLAPTLRSSSCMAATTRSWPQLRAWRWSKP